MVFVSIQRIQLRKGDANDERARIVELDNGDALTIECSADSSFSPSSFMFLHNESDKDFQQTEMESADRRATLRIKKFVASVHEGNYLCAASSSLGGTVERTVVVRRRDRLNDLHHAMRCKQNRCRNGGLCFVPLSGDTTPFCLCPSQFAGKDCDSHAISSYTVQGTKATFGVGGLCSFSLILLCLLFAILYRHEKRKRREAQVKLNDLLPSYFDAKDRQMYNNREVNLVNSSYDGTLTKPVLNATAKSPGSVPYARIESCADLDRLVDEDEQPEQNDPITKLPSPRGRLDGTSDSVKLAG